MDGSLIITSSGEPSTTRQSRLTTLSASYKGTFIRSPRTKDIFSVTLEILVLVHSGSTQSWGTRSLNRTFGTAAESSKELASVS